MTDFIPGTTTPVAPPAGLRKPVPPAKGGMVKVGVQEIELFTLGELAEILNRKPVTIRKWEREGVIPKATFVKPGANGDKRGRRRLYSRAQVEALLEIAEAEKVLTNHKVNLTKTRFQQKAFAAFREIQAGLR